MKGKLAWVLGALCLAVGGYFLAANSFREGERKLLVQRVASAPEALERASAMRLGRQGAPVTVVEFFDPECESCRMFHPMAKQLLNEYEGKIQLVARYAPFHPNSRFAIHVMEAARKQNRYWETLELLYEHQPEWGDHHHPRPEKIWDYLPRLGLDIPRLKQDMQDPAIQELIEEDLEDGMKLGVRGTPSFFVNGEPVQEFGYDPLKAMIARALADSGE